MNNTAIIIGYSGHGFVLLDILLANKLDVIGYCDKVYKVNNPYNLSYLGRENDGEVLKILKKHKVFIGIGDNHIRAEIFEYLIQAEVNCPSIIYSASGISQKAKIGLGTVIMPGVVVNSGASIGKGTICNSSSVIEHECLIGDYVHIAPGAVLAGHVTVGDKTLIGANAVIKQGVQIGSGVTIGAGSVVIKDVKDGITVYGNPVKQK